MFGIRDGEPKLLACGLRRRAGVRDLLSPLQKSKWTGGSKKYIRISVFTILTTLSFSEKVRPTPRSPETRITLTKSPPSILLLLVKNRYIVPPLLLRNKNRELFLSLSLSTLNDHVTVSIILFVRWWGILYSEDSYNKWTARKFYQPAVFEELHTLLPQTKCI
ncbi:hypothetical protein L2E82_40078 [Cichorium intybus]|uniref:Uncharacterized protein n=1 Tax=Cichorium intybus TaxID=13427 RepID=A0ACB9AK20_CICIN|nr:hypothetical protein L2E82_40078 [Cichorium intybus]